MRRAGMLIAATGIAACMLPAGAGASLDGELEVPAPVARDCAEALLPAGTAGIARERWTAPAEGYLTLSLDGDPGAPDWDLAAAAGGAAYASTHTGSAERVNLWVRRGERVAIQACRTAGGDRRVPLSVDLHRMAIPDDASRASLAEVELESPADVGRLERLGIDVTHETSADAATVVLHSGTERARLDRAGYEARTLVPDLAAEDSAERRRATRRQVRSALPSARDDYRVYEDYTTEMKELAAQYPGHVRSITIGTSLEGRPIEGVEIAADVNRSDDGRPVFLNLGLHHAREWPSGEFPMEFAIDLVRGYGTDPRITAALQDVRVITVPVANPDGFIASRSFGTSPLDDDAIATLPQSATGAGTYRRKNCRGLNAADQAIPCAARTSGVDLNRNYGAYWGGPGSSADPTTQIYRGEAPYSEPEAKAVLNLSESVHPTVVISHHTFTEEGFWLRQPGFEAAFLPQDSRGSVTFDEPALKALGDAMAASSAPPWASDRSYAIGGITGATEDWNYYAQGSYGYTPEARGPNFHANYPQMVVSEYLGGDGDATDFDGVRGALIIAAEEAADPDNHGVLTGRAPPGASLRIAKEFSVPTCEDADCSRGNGPAEDYAIETELDVPASGRYSWHVMPSSRPDIETGPGRTPAQEAWSMTCKHPDQPRSAAQQVLVTRGQEVAVDWTTLCGREGGGGTGGGGGGGGGGNGGGGGGAGNERPTCAGQRVDIVGTDGGQVIVGTPRSDVIAAGGGDDVVKPGGGKDVVCAEGGKDKLKGAGGADTLLGQKGRDTISGAAGKDALRGGRGRDRIRGGKGRDRCIGGSGKDRFRACEQR